MFLTKLSETVTTLCNMRIVYIHQYFKTPSTPGGSRSYEMARRLAARGHDVHIVASTSEAASGFTESVENFTVHWLSVPYSQLMSYKERIKAFISFAARAAKISRKLRGDVVFASSTPLTVAIPGIISTLFRRSRLVFEVRDLWPDVPIMMGALESRLQRVAALTLEKFTYRYAAHIVALSPDMRDAIISKGVNSRKVSVIPNASDNHLFQEQSSAGQEVRDRYAWLGSRKLVLYCGTLGLVNDVSYIARLAAEAIKLDQNVRFLIVGKGNDEERVRKAAQELGVYERNFFMIPPVPKTEVPAIFAAADISMSTVAPRPLLAANSANKVFDTFASGTPLAINHEGWLAKLLIETEAGLVLDKTDAEAAARQLLAFLDSPERLKAAGRSSKNLAIENFDRQRLADQLAEILGNVAPQREKSVSDTIV